MRSRSMSVQTTSCPASARQAPVTKPTYPQPMTERRKTSSPWDDLAKEQRTPVHPELSASHCRRIPERRKALLACSFHDVPGSRLEGHGHGTSDRTPLCLRNSKRQVYRQAPPAWLA